MRYFVIVNDNLIVHFFCQIIDFKYFIFIDFLDRYLSLKHVDFLVQLLRNSQLVHSFLLFQCTASFDRIIPVLQITILAHFVSQIVDTEHNAPYEPKNQEIHQNAIQIDMHCNALWFLANYESYSGYRYHTNQTYQYQEPSLNDVQSNYISQYFFLIQLLSHYLTVVLIVLYFLFN